MQFQTETIASGLLEEITPLLYEHWKEIAHFQDIPLRPNIEYYQACEAEGVLRIFTARVEKHLAGYNVFFLKRHPHYDDSLMAIQDILFLLPKYRKAQWGSRFIKWCDEELRKEGVQVVSQHIKAKHNFGKLLERQGYELMDLIYVKRLDQEAKHG